jgi:hypothetical protein
LIVEQGMYGRRHTSSLLRWLRWLLLGLALLGAPGGSDLLRESVSLLSAAACCDDGECCEAGDCKSSAGACCAAGCGHCAFCAHPSAVAAAAVVPLPFGASRALATRWQLAAMTGSGYRAPPFRPPAA